MKVKICGITNLEDALAAIDAGCDMLGFNFYQPSPRCITPAMCAAIQSALVQHNNQWISVGIFVNAPLRWIQETLDQCGLHLAQLAGDEPPDQLAELNGRAFKSIRPTTREMATELASRYVQIGLAPSLLVDAYQPGVYGGSGVTGDWELARGLATQHRLLLAGGLNPQNVGRAATQVQPWGVDVASGVEKAPGKKDAAKMRDFVREAHKARTDFSPPLTHLPGNRRYFDEVDLQRQGGIE